MRHGPLSALLFWGISLAVALAILTPLGAQTSGNRFIAINQGNAPLSIRVDGATGTWEAGPLAPGTVSRPSSVLLPADYTVSWKTDGPWQPFRSPEGAVQRFRAGQGLLHGIVVKAPGMAVSTTPLPSGKGPAVAAVNGTAVNLSIQVAAAWDKEVRFKVGTLAPGSVTGFGLFTRPFSAALWWQISPRDPVRTLGTTTLPQQVTYESGHAYLLVFLPDGTSVMDIGTF